jgi:hypothetical protein
MTQLPLPQYPHKRYDEILDQHGREIFSRQGLYTTEQVKALGCCAFLHTQDGETAFRCIERIDGRSANKMCPVHMAQWRLKLEQKKTAQQEYEQRQRARQEGQWAYEFEQKVKYYKANMTIAPGTSEQAIDAAARCFAKQEISDYYKATMTTAPGTSVRFFAGRDMNSV